jgi:hypothetical protein
MAFLLFAFRKDAHGHPVLRGYEAIFQLRQDKADAARSRAYKFRLRQGIIF